MADSIYGSLKVGDPIHFDPHCLPDLVIISEEEADKIAAAGPSRVFVVTAGASAPRKRK